MRRTRLQMLQNARAKVARAKQSVAMILEQQWPVGTPIKWSRNYGRAHTGWVVSHSKSDRIKVENADTGKEYWIHAYNIRD